MKNSEEKKEHCNQAQTNRREFLKKSASIIGAITIIPSHVVFSKSELRKKDGSLIRKATVAPSEKVNLACCGIGHRGGEIMRDFENTGMVNFAVLCDVDMGGKHTIPRLAKHPKLPRFQDFREMFDKMAGKFDAVSIGTPDFSHFPIAILAMSMGKHVYVEKPLTRTFNESELLIKAAKKFKVATQMGNQGHCQDNYYQFKAWVEAGIIKDVTEITASMNGGRRWHGWDTSITRFPKGQRIPETMDWDTWLMTAQHHDYHRIFVNGQWRCWYDFGNGALGDWGAHIWDTFHQFLELGLPYEVDPIKIEGHNPLFYPQASTLAFKFPKRDKMPPVTVTWYDGKKNNPLVPEGYGNLEIDSNFSPINGRVLPAKELPAGKIIYGKDLTFKGASHGSTLTIIPEEKAKDMASKLPEYHKSKTNHFANFLLACKGQEKCLSPFEISGPLSQVFTLGTMAQKLNTKLIFDRKKKQITNNELANQLLVGTPPRKGWEEFYKLV
ncbi:MAG: Gfo/Idh/MocA family oxidoreductase [Planctomycetes bacterium]|nr:Gfo/Idh/MocA family oxidoreductase [Planctomycetota bacterium]